MYLEILFIIWYSLFMNKFLISRVSAAVVVATLAFQPFAVAYAKAPNTVPNARIVSERISRTGIGGAQSDPAGKPEFHIYSQSSLRAAVRGARSSQSVIVRYAGESRPRRVAVEDGDIDRAIATLEDLDEVEYVEADYITSASLVPNDTLYYLQWNMQGPTNGGVNAEPAWDITNGSGVIVAVLDTGIAYETYSTYTKAPDLASAGFVPGYDFINNDTHPNDDNGHGTHVAGTIAQTTNNASGVAGLAYGAKLMPVKVLNRNGSGTYSALIDGIYYAVNNGAKIINMSLGGTMDSQALRDATAYAYSNGVTIVAAAGNAGTGVIDYPAAYDEYVVAVGASRADNTRVSYSNYGSALDFVAPGGDMSVDQNGDGYGDGIAQVTFSTSPNSFGVYLFQGTSMATPHVAAAAAMLVSAGRASSPTEIENRLRSTARDIGSSGWDHLTGNGIIDIGAALAAVTPTDTPPTVALTAPADGATVSGTVTIAATASDDDGVSSVAFQVNDTTVHTDTSAPYSYAWNSTSVSDGTYTITAVATDSAGQTTTSAPRTVQVDNVSDAITTLFEDGFASGTLSQQWTESNEYDWNIEKPAEKQISGAPSTNTVAHADQCTKSAGCILTMKKAINTSAYTTATLTFDRYVDNGLDSGEFLRVDVWNGSTWKQVKKWTHGSGDNDQWTHITVDLTSHKNSALKVRFVAKMSASTEEVEIDNVKITGTN